MKMWVFVGFLFLTMLVHGYLYFNAPVTTTIGKPLQEDEKKYPFLSKRILQEFPNDILINFLPLRTQLKQAVEPYGTTFGFYFEYLPTGTSIGVNEKSEFESASLFKVPIVMAYFHQKERKEIANDPVVTISPDEIDKEFGELWKKGPGAKIRLDEAVKLAITQSDNTAAQVVSRYIDRQDLERVYEGLDIDLLKTKDEHTIITVKGFSSVLKALFFSSVLSRDHSQQILTYMTHVEFERALRAGVPSEIPVAHKIGVLNDNLFMDCGIVYVPRRPYSLCMVSSSRDKEAERRMIDISSKVYTFVSSR